MSGISVHAVDVAAGRPAEGLWVEVFSLVADRRLIADGHLDRAGLLDHPVAKTTLEPGLYEVLFHIGAYLGDRVESFLDVAPYRFRLAHPDQHYHLPMKFTPWGFSLFRGG